MDTKDNSKIVILSYGFNTFVVTEEEAKQIASDPDVLRELRD